MVRYYYTDGKERFGPFSLEELRGKEISKTTLIWKEGLPDWVPASQLRDLDSLFTVESENIPEGSEPYFETPLVQPKNWLIESIVITIFCCMPFGIVGIVLSSLVDKYWREGDKEVAIKLSNEAGKWVKYGFIFGLIVGAIYFMLIMSGIMPGPGSGIEV